MLTLLVFTGLCQADSLRLNTSYVSQSWRPGAKLGVELGLAETAIEKSRDDQQLATRRQIVLEPSLLLSGTKLREFPKVLLRCKAMKHLVLEDDYFDDAEKKAIEAKLHWVQIRWTYGQYIDGRHGR